MRGQPSKETPARELRRREFTAGTSRGSRRLLMGGLALVAVVAIAVAVAFVAGGGKETTVIAGGQPAQAAGGQTTDGDSDAQSGRGSDAPVSVPLADITGEASFYTAQVDGGEVSFFVVRGSDGDVRSAFNACQVCFQEKLGYRQESDVMVCNNCGRTFPVDQVGVEHGGCNPIPLEATVNGDSFTFAGDALASGAALFK